MDSDERFPILDRRRLLAWVGGLGVTALAAGCAGDDAAAPAERSGAATTTGVSAPDCVLTPELTEGPYYLDLDRVRRDIAEGRPGTPLRLRIAVVDADACEPIAGAAVDVWHCDALGAYSGVQGDTGTFCRGVQLTDPAGVAEFATVYPGWYAGRAVHVHLKVHLGGVDSFTGQLFFDEAVTDDVYGRPPYDARPGRDTLNTSDGIFRGAGDETILALEPDGDGYRGSATLGIRRA